MAPQHESDPFMNVKYDSQSPNQRNLSPQPKPYHLNRFLWRAYLGITGPPLVLGFYSFICFKYLTRPAQNDIVSTTLDARWVYYAWFLLAVFVLDWARTGLANIEALALMRPRLAPRTAMGLMWHTDMKWSNVLWWLRGIRNVIFRIFSTRLPKRQRRRSPAAASIFVPAFLWWLLSLTTLLLFVSIPLSGLTMDFQDAFVLSAEKAPILGPNPATFNNKGYIDLYGQIRANWRSGRPTGPLGSTILYAPSGTPNVSTTYYDDQIRSKAKDSQIQIFAGPAVEDVVHGNAWGLETNITCHQAGKEDLKLIRVAGFDDYSFLKPDPSSGGRWVNETGLSFGIAGYSLVVAVDHWTGGTGDGSGFYNYPSNHDRSAYLLEAFLWQGFGDLDEHLMMDKVLQHESNLVTIQNTTYFHNNISASPVPSLASMRMAGFGIHCEVQSAVGNATLDPAHRTYSDFELGVLAESHGGDSDVFQIQVQALAAIGSHNSTDYKMNVRDAEGAGSTWLAAHLATLVPPVNLPVAPSQRGRGFDGSATFYPALTPDDMQLAIHKLFGEAVIATMDRGTQGPWLGDLYGVDPVRYLKRGVVPWPVAFAMLALWAIILVLGSIWTIFHKRWGPTLDGFAFFKFGAQYTDQINRFESMEFQHCEPLRHIPGMVGALPGADSSSSYGFIGLSESKAGEDSGYVFDPEDASPYRVG